MIFRAWMSCAIVFFSYPFVGFDDWPNPRKSKSMTGSLGPWVHRREGRHCAAVVNENEDGAKMVAGCVDTKLAERYLDDCQAR